ncbi:WXG100 family type VII secretion target [Nocardia beijingensis]
MTGLWADPDRLRAISPQFEQLGDDVNAALERLRQGIQSEGRCWGGDHFGKQFEQKYPQGDGQGSVGECLAALGQLIATLKATGDKITTTADGLQTQDQRNADQLRRN